MLKIKTNYKSIALYAVLGLVILLSFSRMALSYVYYPPSAALGPGDIKSTHILNGTILNEDINASAGINLSKFEIVPLNSFLIGTGTGVTSMAVDGVEGLLIDLVPYTGATADVDLGSYYLTAEGIKVKSAFELWSGSSIDFYSDLGVTITGQILNNMVNQYTLTGPTISAILDLSGITTSDKTFTFPDATGTFALTSDLPSLPLSTANGGTGLNNTAAATGSVPYFSGTGVMDNLAPGTSGKVLQTNGTGAAPSWELSPTGLISSVYTAYATPDDTNENTIASATIPGGSLGTNKAVRVQAFIEFRAYGTETPTWRLKYGATTVATFNYANANNSTIEYGTLIATLQATGSTTSQVGTMFLDLGKARKPADTPADETRQYATGTATENSAADKTLSITVQKNATGNDAEVKMRSAIFELLK